MKTLSPAERILHSVGITDPNEIDLEAIAWTQGVKVKFKPLYGCEARIIGNGDSAIITVNSLSSSRRQRFSIAHELGHWEFHRGQVMVCRPDEIGNPSKEASPAEKRADRFAADLLMPKYLFKPATRMFRQLDFNVIRKVADMFGASLIATAIRIIESGDHPAMIVCHRQKGRSWFSSSSLVPQKWFPRSDLQPESSAFDILFGQRQNDSRLRSVDAEAWFDRYDSHKYEICEQTFKISDSEVLSLLIIEDDEMLED